MSKRRNIEIFELIETTNRYDLCDRICAIYYKVKFKTFLFDDHFEKFKLQGDDLDDILKLSGKDKDKAIKIWIEEQIEVFNSNYALEYNDDDVVYDDFEE